MKDDFLKADFVADAVFEYLKGGAYPKPEEVMSVNSQPLIENLRGKVTTADEGWILKKIKENTGESAGLACSLLSKVAEEKEEIMAKFQEIWDEEEKKEKKDIDLQNRLMWRILDKKDLSLKWRRRFFNFMLDNWALFEEVNLSFYGEGEMGQNDILDRLGSKKREFKKWAYLCCIPGLFKNKAQQIALINIGDTLEDKFAKEVTERLLVELKNVKSAVGNDSKFSETRNNDREKSISVFVVKAIISHVKKNIPDKEAASFLNRVPIIDKLREEIDIESDSGWLLEKYSSSYENKNSNAAVFYLSLLKKYTAANKEYINNLVKDEDKREEIKNEREKLFDILCSEWNKPDIFLKVHLMWRLLDYEKLTERRHREIFKLVMENWEVFKQVSTALIGSLHTATMEVLKRLSDPSFPRSKAWVNLCRLHVVANDKASAKGLITLGLRIEDDFTKEVANILLNEYYKENIL
jgi:hypothetical protein